MSDVRLLLFGPPRIERDGEKVVVDTRKAVALLAYLAVTRRRHGRDALAGLLWPEFGPSRARAALRRTLSSVGWGRAEGWLEADREGVGLDLSGLWVDVNRFRDRLAECRGHGHPEPEVCSECREPLSEAADLYRDDFMAGFGLRDSVTFDDWQYFEAEDLRREFSGVLQRLVRLHGGRGDFEPAVGYARRWLALDHLHEPAHRGLMEVYARSGQRAAAVRQYRECVRVLGQELGVAPLEETTRLYEEIKENRIPPDAPDPVLTAEEPAAPVRESTPGPGSPGLPLVGRSAEFSSLLRSYEASGNGHVAVLEGEAGIGKTRLAEEFLSSIRGAPVLTARCYPGETNLAYGTFVQVLDAAAVQPGAAGRLEELPARVLGEAARLSSELGRRFPHLPVPPPLEGPGAQSRFFEGVVQTLLALCEGPSPGVLFLDDLHWADAASFDLLAYLVRRSRGRPLFVLVTWRGEEVPAGHRLRGLLAEAQRAGAATLLALPRLDRASVVELVRTAQTLPEALGDRLYRETEGLPLFVREYLTAAGGDGTASEEGTWALPGGVRDLLLGRLGSVGETGRQLLGAAAVIGRSFDFDTVRAASGRGEEEVVEALEELVARGLVREVGDGEPAYDFSHERLRDLVYEETSLARRRLLHRRVAEALAGRRETGGAAGQTAAQIAVHYQLAGRDAEAAEYFALAGEHARALYANAEALSHFRTALALGHPDAPRLHEEIGDLNTLLGDYGAALTGYETAAALRDGAALAAVEHKLGAVHQRRGDSDLAESHYRAALDALGDDGPAGGRAVLHADLAMISHHQGRPDEATNLAHQALELAETADDVRALSQAHNVLGILAGSENDPDTARYHLGRSLELAQGLGDPAAEIAALNNLARAYGAAGETGRAIEHTKAALKLCDAVGDRHRAAALHNNLADLQHAAGRPEAAMEHLKQAVAIFTEVGEEGALQPGIWKLAEW